MTIVRLSGLCAAALVLMAVRGAPALAAGVGALSADGLYTWRVEATDEAPAWCCFRWVNDSPVAGVCDLDKRQGGFGAEDDEPTLDGEVQIYVSMKSGKAERIHALSPQCPVKSRREISDLGELEVDESLAWLETRVRPDERESSHALAAIAMHRGPAPMRYLSELASSGREMDIRKDAIFWMGQVRITESADELERLMFRDDDSDIRQHAAFSLSQSDAPGRGAPLIRQGREDRDAEVRSQAWFWLAQTGLPESEEAIFRAIGDDRSAEVREQGVFALSQLPDERAVDALFVVLGNRQLPQDVRKQALFWLAQSDSERASEYLDELLTRE